MLLRSVATMTLAFVAWRGSRCRTGASRHARHGAGAAWRGAHDATRRGDARHSGYGARSHSLLAGDRTRHGDRAHLPAGLPAEAAASICDIDDAARHRGRRSRLRRLRAALLHSDRPRDCGSTPAGQAARESAEADAGRCATTAPRRRGGQAPRLRSRLNSAAACTRPRHCGRLAAAARAAAAHVQQRVALRQRQLAHRPLHCVRTAQRRCSGPRP